MLSRRATSGSAIALGAQSPDDEANWQKLSEQVILFSLDRLHTSNRVSLLRFLLISIPLLWSACAVQSDRPLSTPRYADRDPRLEGLWRAKTDKDTLYF